MEMLQEEVWGWTGEKSSHTQGGRGGIGTVQWVFTWPWGVCFPRSCLQWAGHCSPQVEDNGETSSNRGVCTSPVLTGCLGPSKSSLHQSNLFGLFLLSHTLPTKADPSSLVMSPKCCSASLRHESPGSLQTPCLVPLSAPASPLSQPRPSLLPSSSLTSGHALQALQHSDPALLPALESEGGILLLLAPS